MTKKRGRLAVTQILILVVAIFAFSYNIGVVSARLDGDAGLSKLSTTNVPTAGDYIGQSYAAQGLGHLGISTASGTAGYSAAGIVQGAYWAAAVYGVIKLAGGLFGLKGETVNAVASSAAWGVFVGQAAYSLFGPSGYLTAQLGLTSALSTLGATGIGIVVAIIVFVLTYSKIKTQIIEFQCEPWDAATGGSNCEKCNNQGLLSCSEYQCRSLGQSCELLNPGTKESKCTWVNKNDVDPPIITPLDEALLDGYEYTPDNTISPPDKGVIIVNTESDEKCAKAFTPMSFGIELNEPAKCKLDYIRKDTFDEMEFDFGSSSMFRYNHTQVLALPGPESLAAENLTLENGGEFELYTRCQDANGNYNIANFVFKFCVEEGPDTTPPLIVTTNLLNGMPIGYNQTSVELEAYINEPAECKWSIDDKSYDDMENDFVCSTSVTEMNAMMLYTCKTTLTGLKNNFENEFYFRCEDKPFETQDRNANTQSYEFMLIGTQPLVIDEVGPSGIIKDSTDVIRVELTAKTSAGFNEGEAICAYSKTDSNYIEFFNTNSYEHSTEQTLEQGDYNYNIKCYDLGGNTDIKQVNFTVESDTAAPTIVRAYHDSSNLKLITTEEAECVYDTVDCSYLFDDGTTISTSGGLEHYTDWNTKTNLYIKCRDKYGNDPQPSNICTIIVRAFGV